MATLLSQAEASLQAAENDSRNMLQAQLRRGRALTASLQNQLKASELTA